jgi:hypothetical protein
MSSEDQAPGMVPSHTPRPGAGLQVRMPQAGEFRAFNPDRDLIWCLPRLVTGALKLMSEAEDEAGKLTEAQLASKLKASGFDVDDSKAGKDLEECIKLLAAFFNAVRNPDEKDVEKVGQELLGVLYNRDAGAVAAFRMIIADLLMKRILAEIPFWLEQVRPRSRRDPTPGLDEIEEAMEHVLSKLR